MPGERRLDGDLGRLAVADLANQQYVGVLPHDRAQGRREGESGLLVHLHLHDARDAVLDGVLHGDDVQVALLEPLQRRVQRGGLARAGRAGDENEPLAAAEQRVDARVLVGAESHGVERAERRPPVENADHHLLAARCGERGHAQIDGGAVHRHPGPPVLRSQPIGDVEPRDDLDARDERTGDAPRQRAHVAQHAIDAVAHRDSLIFGLDVDVAGVRADAIGQQIVHQPRDAPAVILPCDGRRDLLIGGEHLHLARRARMLRRRRGLDVCPVDGVGERRGAGQCEPHVAPGGERQRAFAFQIEWIGRGEHDTVVGGVERKHAELARPSFGHERPRRGVGHSEIGQFHAQRGSERPRQRGLIVWEWTGHGIEDALRPVVAKGGGHAPR